MTQRPHHLDTVRCCAICRQRNPRREMLRFYRQKGTKAGWQLDQYHLAVLRGEPKPQYPEGRGLWLCLNEACHHPKILGRAFRQEAKKIAIILEDLA